MVAIIVAAHGESAPALLKTASMILGELEGVTAVTFLPGQGPEDLIEEYTRIAGDAPEVLVLADLFGGSPYNAGARFAAEREGADVVTGVNVPMLVEVLSAAQRKNATLDQLVAKALKAGTKGVRSFRATMAGAQQSAPAASGAATATTSASSPASAAPWNGGSAEADGPAGAGNAAEAEDRQRVAGSALSAPGTEEVIATAPAGTAPATTAPGAVDPNFPRDPEATMDVVFLRIDSRLIHGQVAGNWVNYVAPQTLIAASDAAARDSLRKTLLLQVGPVTTRTNVLDIAKTVRVYFNPEYRGMKTMIVVESPVDALRLVQEGVKVQEINVGGVTFKQGMTQLSEAVYATPEDIQAYKDLDRLGVRMTIQQLPSSSRADMMERLREKGL